MKAYELRFPNAEGGTLLAYMGDFSDDAHAKTRFVSLREIPCDRAELWCGDELILQERRAGERKGRVTRQPIRRSYSASGTP